MQIILPLEKNNKPLFDNIYLTCWQVNQLSRSIAHECVISPKGHTCIFEIFLCCALFCYSMQ